eukprot:1231786-Pleurochrysis_carterae.AAC.2
MFAFSAKEACHGLDFAPTPALGLIFPGEISNKKEIKQFLDSFQDAMDQKAYGAMLRGELLYAALSLTPRSLDNIPSIADTTTGPGAARAAHRAQVERKHKMKQESNEALLRDYSNRIASL